jgi:L-threonylcarbamoyladenylate synthase
MKVVDEAIRILKSGGIVVAQTDTVYGILADAKNESAIKSVYEIKERSPSKPLLVLVSNMEMAREIAYFDDRAEKISNYFWNIKKRPLTIVLKAKKIPKLITAINNTIALRLPNNRLLLYIIDGLGNPVVAPSANISGEAPCTEYNTIKKSLANKVQLIIDGKLNRTQTVSTILDLSFEKPIILREGIVTIEELRRFISI